nr:aspartate/glutamate racemase family protein [Oscillospiraceae bacterium]
EDMPFTGVVYPAAHAACEMTENKRVGIIGTPATVASGSYENAIHSIDPTVDVTAMACPLFVHLVEYGYTDPDNRITRLAAEEYLEPIRSADVDTLILGCTHYPVIAPVIGAIMGSGVRLISASEAAANYAKKLLEENDLLTDSTEKGHNTYYVSDSVSMFRSNAQHFLEDAVNGQVFSSRL